MRDIWFHFPEIDPVAIALGPLVIRWYALAYMAGLLAGWYVLRRMARQSSSPVTPLQIDQLLNAIIAGVIIGGRLGYVLFYQPAAYWRDPLAILRIWEGGMAFHGGLIGVCVAVFWFARHHKIPLWQLADRVALVTPIGLFFGRIANFINGELYGRVTDLPIGMIFPTGGALPRHPSQLYEAALEGVLLGLILAVSYHLKLSQRRPGSLVALFLIGYGIARFLVEFVREPDAHIGTYQQLFIIPLSQGQLLSLPMIIGGAAMLVLMKGKQSS